MPRHLDEQETDQADLKDRVAQARAVIAEGRDSHAQWSEFLRHLAGCEECRSREHPPDEVGTIESNDEWVRKYDLIAAVLADLESALARESHRADRKALQVCEALDAFQCEYKANTGDDMPGNPHYSGKLMTIVEQARAAISHDTPAPMV